jgi:hypothetical protein
MKGHGDVMFGRRGFLKGLFGGVAGTGLIVLAKPSEIEAFTAPLVEGAPLVLDQPMADTAVEMGQHLYNAQGEVVAIVTELSVAMQQVTHDVRSFDHAMQIRSSSSGRILPDAVLELRATVVGVPDFTGMREMPNLRGKR